MHVFEGMNKSNVWFVALCYILLCQWTTAAHNRLIGQSSESNDMLGKSWGWKKQPPVPQNNFIIITRPAANAPVAISSGPLVTSPVAVTSSITSPTAAQVVVRQGNRQNHRNVQRYTNRMNNRQGNLSSGARRRLRRRRRRPNNGNGVYYAREENEENDEVVTNNEEANNKEKQPSEGVNAKLDIEEGQFGKSLDKPKQRNSNKVKDNDNDEAKRTQHYMTRRKGGSMPQGMPAFLPTSPSLLPTYDISNRKYEADDDINRQNIWQGLTKLWRDRRKRRRNENISSSQKRKDENEKQEHEIIIDENGKIHIKKKKKKKKNDEFEHETDTDDDEAETSLINDNNTNSRLQNLINALRLRTPIIYKKQQR